MKQSPDRQALATNIKQWGAELGFDAIGISSAAALSHAEAGLLAWLAAGYQGEMDYMARHGVRRTRPEVFRQRAEQSRRLGVRLVRYRGVRIFLDELPENAVGRPLKTMKRIECGIICEERPSARKQSIRL